MSAEIVPKRLSITHSDGVCQFANTSIITVNRDAEATFEYGTARATIQQPIHGIRIHYRSGQENDLLILQQLIIKPPTEVT